MDKYLPVEGCEDCEILEAACNECVLYGEAEKVEEKGEGDNQMRRFEVRSCTDCGEEKGAVLGFVIERRGGFWFNSRCQKRNSRKAWPTPEEAVSDLLKNGAELHEVGGSE